MTLESYSETQRAILPVIGIRSDGKIEGLETAFCVCDDPIVLVTAKHVIERFIVDNRQDLAAGAATIQVVWETDDKNPDNITDLGAPIPVYRAVYYTASTVQREHEWMGPPGDDEKGLNSDLALLIPLRVLSGDAAVGPTPVQPLGFDLPARDACMYSFGYPEMFGENRHDGGGTTCR